MSTPIETRPDPTIVPAPRTTPDRIVVEIRKFIARAVFFNAQTAEKAGIGLTDMQMIHVLQLYGPATPGRLAAFTGLSSGGVTVALDRLEKAGYVRRRPNPADRRSLLVTLLPARLKKLAAMYQGVEQQTRQLLAQLPEEDLQAVVRFFQLFGQSEVKEAGKSGAGSRRKLSGATATSKATR